VSHPDAVILEIQRALGRLEAQQQSNHAENIRKFDDLHDELVAHKASDTTSFEIIEAALSNIRSANAALQNQDENTRLIGKWIIGAFGTLAFLIGSAVIAYFTNHIQFK